jgi:ABC-type glycerol-3-phosphate transport system substrate-binding protein
MLKKVIMVICITIFFAVFLLFFQDEPAQIPTEKESPGIKQIGFYHYFSGSLSGGLSEMIETVNKSQNHFHVKATALDHEAFKSMILTTLDKAHPPELFSYWAGARVQNLVDQDKLAPIDDLWSKEAFDSRFSPSIVDAACTYNDKKYLLPIDQHFVVFFYNQSLFSIHNLEPPQTWDELLAVCETLKKNNITPFALGAKERWPAQFWMDYLLLRTQPADYRERLMKGLASYTDPQVESIYRTWAALLMKGYFNDNANQLDWAQATDLLCSKEAAMTLMGSWAIPMLQAGIDCSSNGSQFDFFAFPVMDVAIPKAALGPIDGIVLSKYSVNQKFSKQTLAYFASRPAQEKMSLGSGALSPSLEVRSDFYSPFKQRLKKEIDTSIVWAFNYDLATHPGVAEAGMNSFQELIAFPDQYEQILENLEKEARQIFRQLNQ